MPTWPDQPLFSGAELRPATLTAAVKDGRLRRLHRGLYTADLATPADVLVRAHRYLAIGLFIPDAVLVDRSAATPRGMVDCHIFVASNDRSTDLVLPGLHVHVRAGAPHETDLSWPPIRRSGIARTILDNLATSRPRAGVPSRTLSYGELSDWLAERVLINGATLTATIEGEVADVGQELSHPPDDIARALDLVAGIAGRRPLRPQAGRHARILSGDADPRRIALFDNLANHLHDIDPTPLPEPPDDGTTLAFYEAYFSNFIEGTEFTLDEALQIIGTNEVPAGRPQDAHDILNTFKMVVDPLGRATVPTSAESFVSQLRVRHDTLMSTRPEVGPGRFKTRPNRAGMTEFVAPGLVIGTLTEGFQRMQDVPPGWPRALMTMFVVSEVHPFEDGNGRIARIAMNSELSAGHESRVIVPIIWRDEYIANLRAMSRDGNADRYVRATDRARRWTAAMDWSDPAEARARIHATNALVPPAEADERGLRLGLPT